MSYEFDFERLLISSIIQEGDVGVLLDRKIGHEVFQGEQEKEIIKWILDFQREYKGDVPSIDLFKGKFKDYRLLNTQDPQEYYLDKIVENFISVETQRSIKTNLTDIMLNPKSGLEELKTDLTRIELTGMPSEDLDYHENAVERLEHYYERKNLEGIDGYKTPWELLDEATGGVHGNESWAIVARPAVGKSWTLLEFGNCFYKQGLNVLITTKEMPTEQMMRRFDSLSMRVSYTRFKDGNLTSAEEQRMIEYYDNLDIQRKEGEGNICRITTADTLSSIVMKAQEIEADVILIDGAYLLTDERKGNNIWERTTNISRDLKQTAMKLGIPFIHTWQLNRGGAGQDVGTEHIGLSDAIGQDADVVIALQKDKDMELNRERKIAVPKCREGSPPEFIIDFDLDKMSFQVIEDVKLNMQVFEDDKIDF